MISALVFAVVAATGVTAQADGVVCRDGSTSVSGRGACSHHGGVEKHRTARKSTTKRAESRDRHAREDDRVRIPRRTREIDVQPRERRRDPNWIDELKHSHESNQPTAMCNDGEVSYSQHHQGACSDHGGVARWLD